MPFTLFSLHRPFRPTSLVISLLLLFGTVLWLQSDLEESDVDTSAWHSSLTSKLPSIGSLPRPWSYGAGLDENDEDDGSEWNVHPTYMGDDYASNAPSKGGLTGWLGFGKTKSDRLKNEAAVGHIDGIGMGRRVLVTGGAGSLGQDLVRRLLLERYRVTIVDVQNLTSHELLSMIHTTASSIAGPKRLRTIATDVSPVSWYSSSNHETAALTYYHGDIRDAEFLATVLSTRTKKSHTETIAPPHHYNGIVHLAGVSRDTWCREREHDCRDVNVGGTHNLLAAIKHVTDAGHTPPWLMFSSALEVFATDEAGVPLTALGRTKLEAERELAAHRADSIARTGTSSVLVMRPSLVYGGTKDITDRLVPSLVRNALIDLPIQLVNGMQRYDLLHMRDFLEFTLESIKHLQDRAIARHEDEEEVVPASDPADVPVQDSPSDMRKRDDSDGFFSLNYMSGFTASIKELAAIVMAVSRSSSPLQTFETGERWADMSTVAQPGGSVGILHPQDTVDVVTGITQYIDDMRTNFLDYAADFLAHHCHASEFADYTFASEADERNTHLDRLANCTVEIGVKNVDFLHYVKCGGGSAVKGEGDYSDDCFTDIEKVPSMKWNASVFTIKMENLGNLGGHESAYTLHFEEERTGRYLGFTMVEPGEEFDLRLFSPKEAQQASVITRFEPQVQHNASFLQLHVAGTPYRLTAVAKDEHTRYTLVSSEDYNDFDVRFTMICCPTTEPWPLLLDDFETADIVFGHTDNIPFNSSIRMHTCDRIEQAVRRTESLRSDFAQVDPSQKVMNTLTSSRPVDWRLKHLPPCMNDCSNPMICVQTGACRCVQADDCEVTRVNPLAPVHKINEKALIHLTTNHDFVKIVNRVSWKDLLLPAARRIIETFPDLIKVHVVSGYEKEEQIEAAECHKLQGVHCFSADSIMYRAMRKISVPADEADLIILPVYQHCEGAEFLLHDVMHYAASVIPDLPNRHVSLVLTHDWGICIDFAWDIWAARGRLYSDWILDNVMVWSVMGDWISPCYRPHQDVVIPARTCMTHKLHQSFQDMYIVKPASKRPALVAWAGTYWGTGKNSRLRLTCPRGGVGKQSRVAGGGPQSRWLNWDYMNDLNNAIFCPQPTGIAGWSTRPNDAIYAGCIPVLLADGSHYPYADIIDWSKISVRISTTDLDHVEDILAAIPMAQVEQMQANLLAIRDAFIYSSDESPEDELERRGPLFFALQSARIRLATMYPTDVAMPGHENDSGSTVAEIKDIL